MLSSADLFVTAQEKPSLATQAARTAKEPEMFQSVCQKVRRQHVRDGAVLTTHIADLRSGLAFAGLGYLLVDL